MKLRNNNSGKIVEGDFDEIPFNLDSGCQPVIRGWVLWHDKAYEDIAEWYPGYAWEEITR